VGRVSLVHEGGDRILVPIVCDDTDFVNRSLDKVALFIAWEVKLRGDFGILHFGILPLGLGGEFAHGLSHPQPRPSPWPP